MGDCSGRLLYRASDGKLVYRASDGKLLYAGCDQPIITFSGIPTEFDSVYGHWVVNSPLAAQHVLTPGGGGAFGNPCRWQVDSVCSYDQYVGGVLQGTVIFDLTFIGGGAPHVEVADHTWAIGWLLFCGNGSGGCSAGSTSNNDAESIVGPMGAVHITPDGTATVENANP